MGYSTGISSSPQNLVEAIYTFAGTEGWTQVRNNGAGDGTGNNQHSIRDPLSNFQVNMVGDNTSASAHIRVQPSIGDSGSSATEFYDHPGSPDDTGVNGTFVRCGQYDTPAGAAQGFEGTSVGYQLFGGSDSAGRKYIHVVVEGVTNTYWHLHFGHIERAGTLSGAGGAYVTALNVNEAGFVFWPWQNGNINTDSAQWILDNDHFTGGPAHSTDATNWWHQDFGHAGYQGTSQNMVGALFSGGLQAWNQRTPFAPCWAAVWGARAITPSSTAWKLIGHQPEIRLVSMDGRSPGETITLGSDTWHIIPVHRKDVRTSTTNAYSNVNTAGPAPNNDSGLMGFAFLQNP